MPIAWRRMHTDRGGHVSQDSMVRMPMAGVAGPRMVAGIRRLVIIAALAAFAYGTFMLASKGSCRDGSVNAEPVCKILVLRPSLLIFAAIVAIVVGALTLVLRRAVDQDAGLAYLNRAGLLIAVLVIATLVISHLWFRLTPVFDGETARTLIAPFPLGTVEVRTDHVVGP